MYPMPRGMIHGLKFSRMVARVEWSFKGSPWTRVPILEGSVTCDRNATARWAADITLPAPFCVDSRKGINPYGCQFRIFRGIRPPRRAEYLVPWGVYRVEEVDEDTILGGLKLTMFSREKQIEDGRFVRPRQYKNMNMDRIINDLVHEVCPDATIAWDNRLLRYRGTLQNFTEDKDRWGILEGGVEGKSMAMSMGAEIYFDGTGTVRVHQMPRITDAVQWEVDQERFNFLLDANKKHTRDGVFNVIATRTVTSDGLVPVPPQFAWDNEPSSPTYAGPDPIYHPELSTPEIAPFGIVPRYYSNPFFKTAAQAKAAALAIKGQSLGLQQNFTFTSLVNPGLEAGDVVMVQGVRYIVDSWKADLTGASMEGTTRSTKGDVADIEVQQ